MPLGRLHVITDTRPGRRPLEVVRAALSAGAPVVQVRDKRASGRQLYELARLVVDLCAATGAQCIMDDRPDVALAVRAAGAHLGAEDLPVHAARRAVGPRLVLGATARDPGAARELVAQGASYLGVGPAFATSTKQGLPDAPGPAGIADVASTVAVPVIAIGGVTVERVPELVRAGAYGVAVVSEVSDAADPAVVVTRLLRPLRRPGCSHRSRRRRTARRRCSRSVWPRPSATPGSSPSRPPPARCRWDTPRRALWLSASTATTCAPWTCWPATTTISACPYAGSPPARPGGRSPCSRPRVRGGLAVDSDHAVDPRALVHALVTAGEMAGVRAVRRRVTDVLVVDGSVRGVRLDNGESLEAGTVVVAAGAWSGPEGPLAGLPSHVIPPVRPVKGQALRLRGAPVVYVNDAHQENDLEFKVFGEHALVGSDGAAVVPQLAPVTGDVIVPERFYSAFTETDLDATCRVLDIGRVVLVGQHSNCCCRHTSYDAFQRGIEIIATPDATCVFEPMVGDSYERVQQESLDYLKTFYDAQLMATTSLI